MVELVDAQDLGSCVERRMGSSTITSTIYLAGQFKEVKSMKMLQLFKIYVPEEHRVIGFAENQVLAERIAKGKGFWGADASVTPETIKIFEESDVKGSSAPRWLNAMDLH